MVAVIESCMYGSLGRLRRFVTQEGSEVAFGRSLRGYDYGRAGKLKAHIIITVILGAGHGGQCQRGVDRAKQARS